MSYRLKNSDFKPFLRIFDGKVSDLWGACRRWYMVHFGMFLSGESVPLGGELIVESVMECRDGK